MRTIFYSIVTAALFIGLVGCGKSEAEKERAAARQKFTEAVAAIKVRTQGATYSEFRQAELDLKTSYEVNKAYLDDVRYQFTSLDALMTATDYFWTRSIKYPDVPIMTKSQDDLQAVQVISPDAHITEKLNYTTDQINKDPDFYPKNYVHRGLTKISDQTGNLINLLAK